jgi:WD40 repeat protein
MVHSPDGKWIALWTSRPRQDGPRLFNDGYSVRIYEAGTGKELHAFDNDRWTTTLAFSPDGKRLAYGGNRSIHIVDVQTGKKLRQFTTQTAPRSLAYSPDGSQLAAGFDDTTVVIWNPGE